MSTLLSESYAATSAGASSAAVVGFIALLIALFAARLGYNVFKRHGFRPRDVETTLSAAELRRIFQNTVAGTGWSVVDEGNPVVAQSTLLAGIRQQIALYIDESGSRTRARISVIRYSKKVLGGATKAYTLRWRMSSFVNQVQRTDASASIAG